MSQKKTLQDNIKQYSERVRRQLKAREAARKERKK